MTTLIPPELLNALNSTDVVNSSGVTGATTTAALDTLDAKTELLAEGTAIPSAATTDIGAADSPFVAISGIATITSFGATTARNHMWIRASGAFTLTHNAVSLILPTGANIAVAVGDTFEVVRLVSGAGNWAVINYQKADGTALIASGGGGLVLQVLQAIKTDTFATTSLTRVDVTGLTQAITLASMTNRVLISVDLKAASSNSAGNGFVLSRDGVIIYQGDAALLRQRHGMTGWTGNVSVIALGTMTFLDSPGTVGPHIYQVQAKTNTGTLYVNRSSSDTNSTDRARLASSLTLMEIN